MKCVQYSQVKVFICKLKYEFSYFKIGRYRPMSLVPVHIRLVVHILVNFSDGTPIHLVL
jgi:hypothetical protein